MFIIIQSIIRFTFQKQMEQQPDNQSQNTQQHQLEFSKNDKKSKQPKKTTKSKKEGKKKKKEQKAFGFEANLDQEEPDLAPSIAIKNQDDDTMQLGYKRKDDDQTERQKLLLEEKNKQLLKELGILSKNQNQFMQSSTILQVQYTANEEHEPKEIIIVQEDTDVKKVTQQLNNRDVQGSQQKASKQEEKQEQIVSQKLQQKGNSVEVQQAQQYKQAKNKPQQQENQANKQGLTELTGIKEPDNERNQYNQKQLQVHLDCQQHDQTKPGPTTQNNDQQSQQEGFNCQSFREEQIQFKSQKQQERFDHILQAQQQQVSKISKKMIDLLGQDSIKKLQAQQLAKKTVQSIKRISIERLQDQYYNQVANRLVEEMKSLSIKQLQVEQFTQNLIDEVVQTTWKTISSRKSIQNQKEQQNNEQPECNAQSQPNTQECRQKQIKDYQIDKQQEDQRKDQQELQQQQNQRKDYQELKYQLNEGKNQQALQEYCQKQRKDYQQVQKEQAIQLNQQDPRNEDEGNQDVKEQGAIQYLNTVNQAVDQMKTGNQAKQQIKSVQNSNSDESQRQGCSQQNGLISAKSSQQQLSNGVNSYHSESQEPKQVQENQNHQFKPNYQQDMFQKDTFLVQQICPVKQQQVQDGQNQSISKTQQNQLKIQFDTVNISQLLLQQCEAIQHKQQTQKYTICQNKIVVEPQKILQTEKMQSSELQTQKIVETIQQRAEPEQSKLGKNINKGKKKTTKKSSKSKKDNKKALEITVDIEQIQQQQLKQIDLSHPNQPDENQKYYNKVNQQEQKEENKLEQQFPMQQKQQQFQKQDNQQNYGYSNAQSPRLLTPNKVENQAQNPIQEQPFVQNKIEQPEQQLDFVNQLQIKTQQSKKKTTKKVKGSKDKGKKKNQPKKLSFGMEASTMVLAAQENQQVCQQQAIYTPQVQQQLIKAKQQSVNQYQNIAEQAWLSKQEQQIQRMNQNQIKNQKKQQIVYEIAYQQKMHDNQNFELTIQDKLVNEVELNLLPKQEPTVEAAVNENEIQEQVTQLQTQFKVNKKDTSKKTVKPKVKKNKQVKKQNVSNATNIVIDLQEYQQPEVIPETIQQQQKQEQLKTVQLKAEQLKAGQLSTEQIKNYEQNQISENMLREQSKPHQECPIGEQKTQISIENQQYPVSQYPEISQENKQSIQSQVKNEYGDVEQFQMSEIKISKEKVSKVANNPAKKKKKKDANINKQSGLKKDKMQLHSFDLMQIQVKEQEIPTQEISQYQKIHHEEAKVFQIDGQVVQANNSQLANQSQNFDHVNTGTFGDALNSQFNEVTQQSNQQKQQKEIVNKQEKNRVNQQQAKHTNADQNQQIFARRQEDPELKMEQGVQYQHRLQQQITMSFNTTKPKVANKNLKSKKGKTQVKKKPNQKSLLNFQVQIQNVQAQIQPVYSNKAIQQVRQQQIKQQAQQQARQQQTRRLQQNNRLQNEQFPRLEQLSTNIQNKTQQAQPKNLQRQNVEKHQSVVVKQVSQDPLKEQDMQKGQQKVDSIYAHQKTQNNEREISIIRDNQQKVQQQKNMQQKFQQVQIQAPSGFQFAANKKGKKDTTKKAIKKKAVNKKIPNKQQKLQINMDLQEVQQKSAIKQLETEKQQLKQPIVEQKFDQNFKNNLNEYQQSRVEPANTLEETQLNAQGITYNHHQKKQVESQTGIVESVIVRFEQKTNQPVIKQQSPVGKIKAEQNRESEQAVQTSELIKDFEIQFPKKIQKINKPKAKKATVSSRKNGKDDKKDKKQSLTIQMSLDILQVQQAQQIQQAEESQPVQKQQTLEQASQSKKPTTEDNVQENKIEINQLIRQNQKQNHLVQKQAISNSYQHQQQQLIQQPKMSVSNSLNYNLQQSAISSKQIKDLKQIQKEVTDIVSQDKDQEQFIDFNANFTKNSNRQAKVKKPVKKKQSKKPKPSKAGSFGINLIDQQISIHNASAQNFESKHSNLNEPIKQQPKKAIVPSISAKVDNKLDSKLETSSVQNKTNSQTLKQRNIVKNIQKQQYKAQTPILNQRKVQNVKPNALPKMEVKQVSRQSSKLLNSLISMVSLQNDRYLDQVRERVQMLEQDVRSRAWRKSEKQNAKQGKRNHMSESVDYEQIVEENIKLRQSLQSQNKRIQL